MLAAAICRHLADEFEALTFTGSQNTGNVFFSNEPATPNVAVTVYGRPGTPERSFKLPAADPGIQIMVRAEPYAHRAGHDLALAIHGELDHLDGVVLADGTDDEVYVVGCTAAQSAPIELGRDALHRPRFSLNFALSINQVTAHRP